MVKKIVNTVEVPRYVDFTFTRSHESGSLDKIGRECGLELELLKGEISHSEITKYNYNELRHIWETYLDSDALCLDFVSGRHFMEMQKVTKIRNKESLRETNLRRKSSALNKKDSEFYIFENKYVGDFTRRSIKGGRVKRYSRYFE